ncbi:MAG: site-specific recombinase family protein [Betaproteobacteria bacterium]|nr:site-specific recombinase family protein [Betaproteobacteria bacterium]
MLKPLRTLALYWRRWRQLDEEQPLADLLLRARPEDPWYKRVNWLLDLVQWLYAEPADAASRAARDARKTRRLNLLLGHLERDELLRERVAGTMQSLLGEADGLELLCSTGLPREPALASEVIDTLVGMLLPTTPVHRDLQSLFGAVFPDRELARWVERMDDDALLRLRDLLFTPEMLARYRRNGEDALIYLATVISAIGLSPDVRSRLVQRSPRALPFRKLENAIGGLLAAEEEGRTEAIQVVNNALFESHAAILDAYRHLNDHGVSITLVYHLERMHALLKRIEALLALLFPSANRSTGVAAFIGDLVRSHHLRVGIGGLLRRNTALLARKMVEHNAEHGEHYIARDDAEYRGMFRAALGGGVLTAFTTWFKFIILSAHLPKFLEGLGASMNYGFSFVAIQLTGTALATKQPAMTGPVLAGKLESIHNPGGLRGLLDEVTDLMRSQSAAVFGNIMGVVPMMLVICALVHWFTGHPVIDAAKATKTLEGYSIIGPTPLYAAFTGMLLWASSLFAGFADNWFALHYLSEAIAWNRTLHAVVGEKSARRIADFLQHNFSGFAANLSLGLLLGMIPAIADFMGLPLDIRHVTLSSGSAAAAVMTLGPQVMLTGPFWLAVAGIASMALLNVGVSFILAFSVALNARNVREGTRRRIYRALAMRLARSPWAFILPQARRERKIVHDFSPDDTTRFMR